MRRLKERLRFSTSETRPLHSYSWKVAALHPKAGAILVIVAALLPKGGAIQAIVPALHPKGGAIPGKL